MTNNIQWPELRFPPINLHNAPKQNLSERFVIETRTRGYSSIHKLLTHMRVHNEIDKILAYHR